jgi:hypothetical protein
MAFFYQKRLRIRSSKHILVIVHRDQVPYIIVSTIIWGGIVAKRSRTDMR